MKPNVVLVISDAARAHNFSTYGYNEITSPNLSSIAKESKLYKNAISASPWTLPSHASIFTGQYPSNHNCNRSTLSIQSDQMILPAILEEHGYKSYFITSNPGVTEVIDENSNVYYTDRLFPSSTEYSNLINAYRNDGFGLDFVRQLTNSLNGIGAFADLFNLFHLYSLSKLKRLISNPRLSEMKGSKNNYNLFKKLGKKRNTPYFIYLNFMETHLKYIPPKKYRERFLPDNLQSDIWKVNQDSRLYNYVDGVEMDDFDFEVLEGLYNGAIRFTDDILGDIFQFLAETNQLDNTMLIFAGDHGENIGDNNRMGHSLSLSDKVLRVPLIVKYPNDNSAEELDQLVQLHDLYPTILQEAGINHPEIDFQCDSQALPRNKSEMGRNYAFAEYLGSPFNGIKILMEDYPDIDYSKFDYEIKTVYNDNQEKYTIYSTGEEMLEKINDMKSEPIDDQEKMSSLREIIFSNLNSFGYDDNNDKRMDGNVEEKLRDLGYI